jgi:hypothetical protein
MDKDSKIYKKVKAEADRKFKEKTSAYKSLYIVRRYKELGGKYDSKSKPKKTGSNLRRWLKEKWVRISPKTGKPMRRNGKLVPCGRSEKEQKTGIKKGLCRPYKRISKNTPKTAEQIGTKEMKKRVSLKKRFPNKVITRKLITKNKTMQSGGGSKNYNQSKSHKNTKDDIDIHNKFNPNLTPYQIFALGSFGGTYWRPIKHNGKELKNQHKKYRWEIPDNKMTLDFNDYDKSLNKYGEKVGTTLSFWRSKGWIKDQDPYGWVQWYAEYHNGRRSPDDKRQIKRWLSLAGPKGRFRKWLITNILKKGGKWNDESISPKIRQTLQHWGYKLTKKDFDMEVKSRK